MRRIKWTIRRRIPHRRRHAIAQTAINRLAIKTLDQRFRHEFESEFEMAPRVEQGILELAKEVFSLDNVSGDRYGQIRLGQTLQVVAAAGAPHGRPLQQTDMVQVVCTLDAGNEPLLLKDKQCCGRPAVSKGLLDEARRLAVHNIRLLASYTRQGLPIVGCEPRCMSMLVNDYLDPVPGEDVKVVTEQSMMLDAFLVNEAKAGKLADLHFDGRPRNVLFHGHCQQKASFGTASICEFGVDPIMWTPLDLWERSPQCQEHIHHTHQSIDDRSSNWSGQGTARRILPVNLNQLQ